MSIKFKRSFIASAILMGASALSLNAQAGNINDYTLNFHDAGIADSGDATLTNLAHVDEWTFTAWAVVGFYDGANAGNAAGQIDAGDTYEDFVLVRINQFQDSGGNVISNNTGYGRGGDHEVTVQTAFAGDVTATATGPGDPGGYAVLTMEQFDTIFDSADANGGAYTSADILTSGTFTDGTIVEDGTLVAGNGATTVGPAKPDGTIDIVVELTDQLSNENCGTDVNCGPFELYDPPLSLDSLVFGIVDGNNNAIFDADFTGGHTDWLAAVDTIDTAFGGLTVSADGTTATGSGGDFDFFFLTKSDGSFNKLSVVPEPSSIALMGIGLLGLGAGAAGRRRRKA